VPWSGAGGHVSGQDVVGVAVEVLAGPVVAHGGARVGVAGGGPRTRADSFARGSPWPWLLSNDSEVDRSVVLIVPVSRPVP
jgi:hypothetical protein